MIGDLPCSYVAFNRRSTVQVKLNTRNAAQQLAFEPGDHVAIFPANKASLVQELIDLMHVKPDPNEPIRIEVALEDSGECLFALSQMHCL